MRSWLPWLVLLTLVVTAGPTARAQSRPEKTAEASDDTGLPINPDKMVEPGNVKSTMKLFVLLTLLSLAPTILLMTTCFVRFVVVLGLLRQALGTQQLPPNQVLISLSLFLTIFIMTPVWQKAYNEGVVPYDEERIGEKEAMKAVWAPVQRFMLNQIIATGNERTLWAFLDYFPPKEGEDPDAVDRSKVPPQALLPAFMLSELKTAFIIGFQLYLPFLVIDMVVASVLISMGMMMLPPVLVSLPFKLLLFVLVNGWHLVVGMLLQSVAPFQ